MENLFKDYQLHPIGGLSHSNYLIHHEQRAYVLRIPTFKNNHDFHPELSIRYLLSEQPFTPPLLYFNADNGMMISEYVADAEVFESLSNDKSFLMQLAGTLKSLHKIQSDVIFDPFQQIKQHIAELQALNFEFPDDFDVLVENLNRLEHLLKQNTTYGLCHNDLNVSNILYKTEQIYFIDFEYTGMNDIFYDLATFGWLLSPSSRNTFLMSYFGLIDESIKQKFENYLYVVKMWNMTWSYLKHMTAWSNYDFKGGGDWIYEELIGELS